ncbi:MAG: hypothetical protein GY847_14235 [Proteobacteria bacterium]|nr:hypothetical protein [Pseudomonadota bacterium]
MKFYKYYASKNLLPYGGGIADQPAYLMNAFDIIDAKVNEIHIAQQAERDAKSKRK